MCAAILLVYSHPQCHQAIQPAFLSESFRTTYFLPAFSVSSCRIPVNMPATCQADSDKAPYDFLPFQYSAMLPATRFLQVLCHPASSLPSCQHSSSCQHSAILKALFHPANTLTSCQYYAILPALCYPESTLPSCQHSAILPAPCQYSAILPALCQYSAILLASCQHSAILPALCHYANTLRSCQHSCILPALCPS